jgi:hypothetical protein
LLYIIRGKYRANPRVKGFEGNSTAGHLHGKITGYKMSRKKAMKIVFFFYLL